MDNTMDDVLADPADEFAPLTSSRDPMTLGMVVRSCSQTNKESSSLLRIHRAVYQVLSKTTLR